MGWIQWIKGLRSSFRCWGWDGEGNLSQKAERVSLIGIDLRLGGAESLNGVTENGDEIELFDGS